MITLFPFETTDDRLSSKIEQNVPSNPNRYLLLHLVRI